MPETNFQTLQMGKLRPRGGARPQITEGCDALLACAHPHARHAALASYPLPLHAPALSFREKLSG